MPFDQDFWSRVYRDLEADIDRIERQTGRRLPIEIAIDVDRTRFLIDAGATGEAIALLDDISDRLAQASGGAHRSIARGAAAGSVTYGNLDKLSAELTRETRFGSARLEITGETEEEPPPPSREGGSNTKVNRSTTFDDIKDEYARLFETAVIRPERQGEVTRMTDKIITNRAAYETISQKTSVPWFFVGLLHAMECSLSFKKHLHNGDSLNAKTWQVPPGRPKEGDAPFTFEHSAIDALEYDKFAGKTDWPLPMILYRIERYNGMGYRKKFAIASPYLWSFTNHHVRGKYVADGVWDPSAISKQIGAAVMLRDLVNRTLVSFDVPPPQPVAVAAAPTPAPVPPPPSAAPTEMPPASPSPLQPSVPSPASSAPATPVAAPAAPAPAPASIASAIGAIAAAATPGPSPPAAAPASTPAPTAPAAALAGVVSAIGAIAAAAAAKPPAPVPTSTPADLPQEPETTGT